MIKVLVVDDSKDFRDTMIGVLRDDGYESRGATNEVDAITAVMEDEFDYAVIDVRLHGHDEDDESGIFLAMSIKAFNPRIRTLLVTGGRIRAQQVARAVKYHGVIDFIEKSPDINKLVVAAIARASEDPGGSQLISRDAEHSVGAGETRLVVSISDGQPILVRASGQYVRATQTPNPVHLKPEFSVRVAESARTNLAAWRLPAKDLGDRLRAEVFEADPKVVTTYSEAIGRSSRVHVVLQTTRELVRVPFEFLRSGARDNWMVLEHPLSRFLLDVTTDREALSPLVMSRFTTSKKLRVLLIASNTNPPVPGVDAQVQAIAALFNKLDPRVAATTLLVSSDADYERVQEELCKPDYDIIHYTGHGVFVPKSPEDSYLSFWEDAKKQETEKRMTARELKMLLDDSKARFVFLNCCSGAAAAGESALLEYDFLGLADAVIQSGVPTVLGYRWPVSVLGAAEFAKAFYDALLREGRPQVAVWRARKKLAVNGNDDTWLSPILVHQE